MRILPQQKLFLCSDCAVVSDQRLQVTALILLVASKLLGSIYHYPSHITLPQDSIIWGKKMCQTRKKSSIMIVFC